MACLNSCLLTKQMSITNVFTDFNIAKRAYGRYRSTFCFIALEVGVCGLVDISMNVYE